MKERTFRHGALAFSALESGEGPVVLCLHGFPDHARSFRSQWPALADAGFRAISPTMRGYEPSSQPADGDYHILRMAEDVEAFIDDLGVSAVHLVGHDWGAVVSYLVAARTPERLLSLTTIAVPNPKRVERELLGKRPSQLLKSWYMMFFQLRGIADYVVERDDFAFIERLWREWSPGWEVPRDELDAVKHSLAQPGVKKAALGYYRAFLHPWSASARETRELFSKVLQVPTLAITGALDGCVDTRLHDDLMHPEDFARGLRVERIEGAGHFVHQEKPDVFNRLLIDWVRRH